MKQFGSLSRRCAKSLYCLCLSLSNDEPEFAPSDVLRRVPSHIALLCDYYVHPGEPWRESIPSLCIPDKPYVSIDVTINGSLSLKVPSRVANIVADLFYDVVRVCNDMVWREWIMTGSYQNTLAYKWLVSQLRRAKEMREDSAVQ
ncbi:hypothetical protein CC1G_13939 [Coprinopsis cinerea okayama7|uniref:Uncharacterized protein n=1 Tax=Coprinopsis cinerea (strain Okayama-7 / 130 / ATCC MYA-4618 / FGSC 9003) TaxID=240176 RepID=D6RKP7_COPC7|nr:hypothetical protein CC1G_13939 [Coprinopsis cinerea okayama7\|eukprot:XP_002911899.1 hypothetical protein CC1G_13939 [Coprinopsis cinerea okayama7\